MITDYNRGNDGALLNQDQNDLFGGQLKAMGGNLNKLTSKYASAKNSFDDFSGVANNLASGTMETTEHSYTGSLDIGNAIKASASGIRGMSGGPPAKEKSSNLFQDLIDLIIGLIELPGRFRYMFMSALKSTEMLALGISGIFQSTALGIEDIGLLFYELLKLIAKYGLCILSFFVTLFPCFIIHIITALCFIVYYWLIYVPISGIDKMIGTSTMKIVDKALAPIWWPKPISLLCYTCFGTPVKLTDFMDDVNGLQEASDKMSSDFNVKIPRYMRPATPAAKEAHRYLNKAFE